MTLKLLRFIEAWMIVALLGLAIWQLWGWLGVFWYCIGHMVLIVIDRVIESDKL